MTLASWFSSLRRSRRLTQTGARLNRSRAFRRRASFDALEGRVLLSTVNFSSAGESVNASGGAFAIAVTLSGGTPTISTFASGINEPGGLAFDVGRQPLRHRRRGQHGGQGDARGATSAPSLRGSRVPAYFATPTDLAFNSAGDLFVVNDVADTVSEVTPAGHVSTFAIRVQRAQGTRLRYPRQPLCRKRRQ